MIRLLLFLLGSVALACNNPSGSPGSSKLGMDTAKNIYTVISEDNSMNAAIAKARETIDEFDKAFESKTPGLSDFTVKKPYNTETGGHEHMWIAVLRMINGDYEGVVNNEAQFTQEVAFGDTVLVKKNELSDWMYLDDNFLRGGYTIREMRNHLTKEERVKFDGELYFKIE